MRGSWKRSARKKAVFSGDQARFLEKYTAEDRYVGSLVGISYAEAFKARSPLLVSDPGGLFQIEIRVIRLLLNPVTPRMPISSVEDPERERWQPLLGSNQSTGLYDIFHLRGMTQ